MYVLVYVIDLRLCLTKVSNVIRTMLENCFQTNENNKLHHFLTTVPKTHTGMYHNVLEGLHQFKGTWSYFCRLLSDFLIRVIWTDLEGSYLVRGIQEGLKGYFIICFIISHFVS